MKTAYKAHQIDHSEMPTFDESIFYPENGRRKLRITDEDMKDLIDFFKWQLNQRNRQFDCQHIIAILKLRMEKLIQQKRFELARELEAFQRSL